MTEAHMSELAGVARPVKYDARDGWPAPNARLLNGGQRKAPKLPIECFGAHAEWLREIAATKSSPVDYVAAPFLAFAAGAIGAARVVELRPGWIQPPILWVASVGNPSAGKSPPLATFKRAIMRVERDEAGDIKSRRRQFEADRVEAAERRAKWELTVKEAVKHDRAAPPMPEEAQEPEEPRAPRIVVADVTTEKLAEMLGANARGLISVRDELAGTIGNFGKYGGEDAPFYLSAYDGDFSPVDRKKGGTITAERAFLSMVGAIQPDKLQGLLSGRANDGLVSRFLPVWPDPVARVWQVPAADEAHALAVFERLRSLTMNVNAEGALEPRTLRLSNDAAKVFGEWWTEQGRRANDTPGFLGEFLGKSAGTCGRVALVLELLDWAYDPSGRPDGPSCVTLDAVRRACELFDDYFEPMALRVYGDAGMPQDERLAVALVKELVRRKVRTFNSRELYRGEGWRLPGISGAAEANAACAVLEECDCIRKPPREGPGRPKGDWIVSPHLWGDA